MEAPDRPDIARRASARLGYAAIGLVMVGLGGLGLVVPGLPATMFFVGAAWCFSRSSPRLERWLLGLPVVGALVGDYRDGLGMARSAKVVAISVMWMAITISAVVLRQTPWLVALIVALGLIGTAVVSWRVPTKERVLAVRAAHL